MERHLKHIRIQSVEQSNEVINADKEPEKARAFIKQLIEHDNQADEANERFIKHIEKDRIGLNKIALIHVYKKKQITKENAINIAFNYGYSAKYSGHKLYLEYNFYRISANRKGRPKECTLKTLTNKIKLFEGILKYLTEQEIELVKDEIKILNAYLKKEEY